MEREALKLAFEAHRKDERHHTVAETRYWCNQYKLLAHQAIEALAQPAQEPVSFVDSKLNPIQRPWVAFTGNEWFEWWRVSKVADATRAEIDFNDFLIIAQVVIAKLKEKNNG